AGDPVALDWSAWHTVESPELQVRVVDVKVALEGLTWPEEARLTLRVADPDCDWNDGTFALELGPGGAGVARADAAEPDAALDVGALAALLTGASPPASLLTDGRAEGSLPALRALAGALREHPVFKSHNDHFRGRGATGPGSRAGAGPLLGQRLHEPLGQAPLLAPYEHREVGVEQVRDGVVLGA